MELACPTARPETSRPREHAAITATVIVVEQTGAAGGGAADPRAELHAELVHMLAKARGVFARLAPQVHPRLDGEGLRLLLTVERVCENTGRGARGADLVAALGVHKSSISRGVTYLEGLGLLTRTPDDRDARAHLLEPTEEGARCLAAAHRQRDQEVAAALAGWSNEELCAAASVLRRLTADLG
jgi:DNA-binding MarR family transcriptional regulator